MALKLKPYPIYKESGVPWLGNIPTHWEMVPGLAVLKKKNIRNDGMKETTVLSLSYGRIVVKPRQSLHGLVPESFETYQIVEPGNIIIRPTDLQNDWNSLRVGIARDRGIITSAYLCLETTNNLISEYSYWLLLAYDLMKIFYGMGSGLRQNLDFGDLKWMPVIRPSEAEQKQIVEFLISFDRHVNRLIRSKRRLIELLNEQKQAIIHHAVTRGLDPNVRLKPSGIDWLGDVPAHWEVKRIKQVARIVRGKFSHRPRNDPDFYDGTYPFIQTGDVSRATKFVTKYGQTLNDRGLAISKMFASGTLAMTIAANIGDVAILSFDACFPDSIVGFETCPLMNRDYLYYVFSCMKQEFLREAPVNTQGNLNVERLGTQTVPCPPLNEQQKIVINIEGKIKSLGECIDNFRLAIDLLREYRTRLIADVVTGKLDVTGVKLTETFTEMDFDGNSEVNERETDGYDDMDEAVTSDE